MDKQICAVCISGRLNRNSPKGEIVSAVVTVVTCLSASGRP